MLLQNFKKIQSLIHFNPYSYQVSYISVATREIFSKVGRELLAAIASAHPDVISILLERLKETIDKVGMVCYFR